MLKNTSYNTSNVDVFLKGILPESLYVIQSKINFLQVYPGGDAKFEKKNAATTLVMKGKKKKKLVRHIQPLERIDVFCPSSKKKKKNRSLSLFSLLNEK